MRDSTRLFGIAAATALVAACSDSSGPSNSTTLSTEQKTALATALATVYDGNTGIAFAAARVVMLASAVGRLDAGTAGLAAGAIEASVHGLRGTNYVGAVGFQIIEDDGVGNFHTNTAVVGWDGLKVQSKTVDQLVFAGAITSTAAPAGTGSYAMNAGVEPTGIGLYASQVTTSTYYATTGAFTLTGSSFSGALQDCSEPGFSCSYRLGSMNGSFYFTATRIDGGGPTAYTQPTVSFTNLPAVQVLVTPAVN